MLQLINSNIAIIQVIIPLLFSIICSLFTTHRSSWTFSLIIVLCSFLTSIVIICKTLSGEIIKYNLGGWTPPYGIEIKVDLLNSIMLVVVNFISLISLIYGFHINEKEISGNKIAKFYTIFLISLSGLLGILVSNDVFNIYVFLEILSISAYIVVAMGPNKFSLLAGFEYLIVGSVGATFYLLGIGFLYSMTGTLNISDLANLIQDLHYNKTIQTGAFLVIIGLSTKIALFPFHNWLIKAYSYSPTFISVFFSGATTKVMLYLMIRMIYCIFSPDLIFITLPLNYFLIILSSCAIIFSSISAVYSNKIKKILSYSTIAQIGYIVLAIGLNSIYGLTAAIINIINHSITKCGLFMISGYISYNNYNPNMENNYIKHIILPLIVLSSSIIGLPLTSGFINKWYIILAVLTSNYWPTIIVVLVGSLLSLAYMWKIVEIIYFKIGNNKLINKQINNPPIIMLISIWITTLITIIIGIYCSPITRISERIANILLTPQ